MTQQTISKARVPAKEPPYAWIILLAVYLASLSAPLNQFKVPPVIPLIMEDFNMDLSSAGILMSVFSIIGCILAIPSGLIIQRLGLKTTGLIATGSVLAGALIGSLADTSGMLFFGRLVEGTGMGLIMVMAPAAIALWFPANRRGAPMGIWATCVGIGCIAMYNIAPSLAKFYGLKAVWWLGTIVAFVSFTLFALLFRSPRPEERQEAPAPESPGGTEGSIVKVMSNHRLWMISLQFLCYNLVIMAFSTYYPTFLNEVRNYSLAQASFMSSLSMIVSIFTVPLAGYLVDKIGKHRYWVLSSWVIGCVLFVFPFSVTGWLIPGFLVAVSVLTAPIVPVSFAAIPEIVGSPKLAGMGMAVMALGQNVGMLIGPAAFGYSVENLDWLYSCYLLLPFFLVAFIATWIAKIR